jgi:hypothetical protein
MACTRIYYFSCSCIVTVSTIFSIDSIVKMKTLMLILSILALSNASPQFPLPQPEISIVTPYVTIPPILTTTVTTRRPTPRSTRRYTRIRTTTTTTLSARNDMNEFAKLFADATFREEVEYQNQNSPFYENSPAPEDNTLPAPASTFLDPSLKTALDRHSEELKLSTQTTSWLTLTNLVTSGNLALLTSIGALGKRLLYAHDFACPFLHTATLSHFLLCV